MSHTTKPDFRPDRPASALPPERHHANLDAATSLLALPRSSPRKAAANLWRSGHLVRVTIIAWCIIMLMSVGRAALLHHARHCGCYLIFAEAGRAWIRGDNLYTAEPWRLDVYRYSPLTAVLLAPIGALPDMLGCAVLRAINLGVFVFALCWWSKYAAPVALSLRQRALFLLLAAPLAARSLVDMQVNGLTIGLLLLGATAFVQKRTNWATACFVLACLVKAYVISFVLVLILLYPRKLLFRFLAMAILGLALPFAFQRPDYVLRQCEDWIRWGLNNRDSNEFQDLRFLLAEFGISVNQLVYSTLQVTAGLAIALFCFRRQQALVPGKQLVAVAMGLTCGWMMLLGPATEGTTYVLLAPAMAWIVVQAYVAEASSWQRALALSAFTIFTAGQFGFWFPWGGEFSRLGTFPIPALLTVATIVVAELRSSQPASDLTTGREETLFVPIGDIAAPAADTQQERKAA